MATHRAAVLVKAGEPLVTQDVKTPQDLAPYEVLVRTHAFAINPVDHAQWTTGLFVTKYPHVIGVDCAGVIERVGSEVTDRKVGQRVACVADGTRGFEYAAFQEKVLIWSACTFLLPDHVSFVEAATFPLTYVTAAVGLGLYLSLPLFPSQPSPSVPLDTPILITGGASSVGQCCLQLLRNGGYTNVVTTASPHNHELCKRLGAKEAVDYKAEDQVERVERALGGKAEVVYGAMGGQELIVKVADPDKGKVALSFFKDENLKWPVGPVWASGWRYYDHDPQGPKSQPGKGPNPSDFAFGQQATAALEKALADHRFEGNPVRKLNIKGGDLGAGLVEGLESWKKGVSGEKVVVEM